jgi:DNA primase
VRYRGRDIDVVGLWENYVDFPHNADFNDQYFPKVQCPNPKHDTLKRHFQINADDGLVHCFAHCGISGTFTHAIQIIEGCSEREAQRILLKHSTSKATKRKHGNKSSNSSEPAKALPDLTYASHIPEAGLGYLERRGISGASIAAWELGWNIDELRIVIPAKDERGITKFLIRRATKENQQPKYLYTEDVPKTSLLFGACQTDQRMIRSQGMILVEGSLDAIRLHQNGFTNACAILGTGISKAQTEIVARMRPKRIYLMFDKDVAGVTNIEIAKKRLYKYPLFVVKYPKGKSDPAELTKEEIRRQISRAVPVHRFFKALTRTTGGISVA